MTAAILFTPQSVLLGEAGAAGRRTIPHHECSLFGEKEAGNLKISKTSPMKKALVAGVAVGCMLAGTVGPAAASAPGAGAFEGHEHVTEAEFVPGSTNFCAKFPAGTEHHHAMEGTLHLTAGIGKARYIATADYYANPEGTWSDSQCSVPYLVPGDMTIEFTGWTCSGTGQYQRRLTSQYTLNFNGSCNGTTPTRVTFTGTMVACDPIVGCPVVHPESQQTEFADALMDGTYVQTDS